MTLGKEKRDFERTVIGIRVSRNQKKEVTLITIDGGDIERQQFLLQWKDNRLTKHRDFTFPKSKWKWQWNGVHIVLILNLVQPDFPYFTEVRYGRWFQLRIIYDLNLYMSDIFGILVHFRCYCSNEILVWWKGTNLWQCSNFYWGLKPPFFFFSVSTVDEDLTRPLELSLSLFLVIGVLSKFLERTFVKWESVYTHPIHKRHYVNSCFITIGSLHKVDDQ